jgi:hypothetical protein
MIGRRRQPNRPGSRIARGIAARLHRSAHGFSIEMMVELINGGFASASAERMVAGILRKGASDG